MKIKEEWFDGTKIFGDVLIELAEKDSRVVFVGADSYRGGGLISFRERFPDRFIEVGVAEQNAAGHAAGLAFAGKKPFYSAIANFSTLRCFEQIRNDIARPGLNVAIVGRAAGISYGTAGATHHSIDDMGTLRILPGMTIVDPADLSDYRNTIFKAIEIPGPIYFRKHKQLIKKVNPDDHDFKFGKGIPLREGKDLTIIACGTMVYQSMLASEILEKAGINAGVINMHTIKPIDETIIKEATKITKRIVTVEEHTVINGLGSAVAEVLVKDGDSKQLAIGFNDAYPTDGPYMEVLNYHKLTGPRIAEKIKEWI